jgi:hypothetical protein
MKGALPPSSSESFFTVGADWAMSNLPTSVDPVKVIMRTSGLAVSSAPIASASPVTTFSTPSGKPARSASSARASAESGVSGAGFTTTVQPAARAGAILRVIMATGKFHGVMAPTTPTGCFITRMRPLLRWLGMISP